MNLAQSNIDEAVASLSAASARGQLSPSAVENIRTWLTAPQYAAYIAPILDHIRREQWRELDDAFWTVIPFGTAGRRGKMYPIGTNAINERTMGESAQGLADYVRRPPLPLGEGRGEGAGESAAAQISAKPSPHGRGQGEGAASSSQAITPSFSKPLLPAETLQFARDLRRNSTDAEQLMWGLLRNRRLGNFKFRRQHPIGPYFLDFYCDTEKLAIELDSGQHNSEEGRQHDESRTRFLTASGIQTLRFWNHEVFAETEVVLEAIWAALQKSTLTLALSQRERGPYRCAVAYDTRHRSREFAELCAEVMVAAGFEVLFFDGIRPTPELSFTVRDRHCDCGIMISASHNPPSDNAIKVFWSSGVQLRPPHDAGVIACVKRVTEIRRTPFNEAVATGQIQFCQDEQDVRYQAAVLEAARSPLAPREERTGDDTQTNSTQLAANHLAERDDYKSNVKILYSPLHGVGLTSISPILHSAGFTNIEIYEPHATPDGNFPNVPDQVANPENPAVFDALIAHAEQIDADLILASDPDADRIGCAARVTMDNQEPSPSGRGQGEGAAGTTLDSQHPHPNPLPKGEGASWQTLTGNQIGALLAEFLLRRRQTAGRLTPEHYVVKTLVTSDMICRIAAGFGARAFGDVLTGFKWIGGLIDEVGPEKFVFGFEEAHGYLAGTYTRDKDGAIAALLLAELATECKAAGKTLHDQLDELFVKYGCHLEKTVSRTLPGADGVAKMNAIMQQLRTSPPTQLGGLPVERVRDYLTGLDNVPPSDLLIFDLAPTGNRAAIRPSGTEPKLKFYLFAYEPPCPPNELPSVKQELHARLTKLEADFRTLSPWERAG